MSALRCNGNPVTNWDPDFIDPEFVVVPPKIADPYRITLGLPDSLPQPETGVGLAMSSGIWPTFVILKKGDVVPTRNRVSRSTTPEEAVANLKKDLVAYKSVGGLIATVVMVEAGVLQTPGGEWDAYADVAVLIGRWSFRGRHLLKDF